MFLFNLSSLEIGLLAGGGAVLLAVIVVLIVVLCRQCGKFDHHSKARKKRALCLVLIYFLNSRAPRVFTINRYLDDSLKDPDE